MGFWNNVLTELDYLGMTNKALAEAAGFDPSNIGRGLRYNSSPSADTAVKIARILNVSVEYLVTGSDARAAPGSDAAGPDGCRKYAPLIKKLDSLPQKSRDSVVQLITSMSADFGR